MATETLVDLTPFCDPPGKSLRYKIDKPFTVDGYTFATDGRIVIRVPAREGFECEQGIKYPKLTNLADWTNGGRGMKPCPIVDGCNDDEADQWWRIWEDCGTCLGNGICSCPSCDADHNCGKCDGDGRFLVADEIAGERIVLNDNHYARRYMWLISQLPNVRINTLKAPEKSTLDGMLFFEFDGGCGYLACMIKE